MVLTCISLAVGLTFCTVSALEIPLDSHLAVKQAVPSSGGSVPASSFTSAKASLAVSFSTPVQSPTVSSVVSASSAEPSSPSSEPPAPSEPSDSPDTPAYKTSLPKGRTVYLTFDDGPSSLTRPLLDVLDRYHVKATFFVVGVNDKNEIRDLQDIVNRGHAIGVHSWTHNYHQIYASESEYFSDFDRIHKAILDATGVNTKICRFPGGSVNDFNPKTRRAIIKGLKQRGYVYFDWNVSSGDAGEAGTPDAIYNMALKGVHGHRVSVVLFHNTAAKRATLQQLPRFISTLKNEGYQFAVLDPTVNNAPFIF